jgi:hypothetical protein
MARIIQVTGISQSQIYNLIVTVLIELQIRHETYGPSKGFTDSQVTRKGIYIRPLPFTLLFL